MHLTSKQINVLWRFCYCAGALQIERQTGGGVWTIGGIPAEEWHASTQTILSMVVKGLLVAQDWIQIANGRRYVIAYRLTEEGAKQARIIEEASKDRRGGSWFRGVKLPKGGK